MSDEITLRLSRADADVLLLAICAASEHDEISADEDHRLYHAVHAALAAPSEGPERAATGETLDSGVAPDWAVEALGVDAWNAVRARYAGCNSCIQEIQAAMPAPAWEAAARGVVEAILAAGWNIAPDRHTAVQRAAGEPQGSEG